MAEIYYIGGSPCCGKSTLAEQLKEVYGFQYYKVDDDLFHFIEKGAEDGDAWLKYIASMSLDELWLRNPMTLNEEALITYKKLLPYFIDKLTAFDKNTPIITEGAAFLPYLMSELGIDKNRYLYMIPTKEFQMKHYLKREWVDDYLSSCSDKKTAFINWMERDVLFAKSVCEQAKALGYKGFTVDGSKSIEETFKLVVEMFGLAK